MALRQIMLSKKIEDVRSRIAELKRKQNEDLVTRESELEAALEEAKTDEEIATVEKEIEDFEKDKEETEAEIGKLEEEMNGLEQELEESRSKNNGQAGKKEPEKHVVERGEDKAMIKRGIFAGMTRSEVNTMVTREDVKGFLERVRSLKDEERAVTGADLTIPEVVLSLLRDNMNKYSKLISKVTLKPLKGKARQNILGTIPEAVWTEMVGSLNELTFGFNQVEVDGFEVGGFIPVPDSTLEDSDENLAAEIFEMLGQAIGLALDKAILYGTGTRMPLGFITRLAQTAKPSNWNDKNRTWEDLHTSNIKKINASTDKELFQDIVVDGAIAKPNFSDGTLTWVMNRKTHMQLLSKALDFNAAGSIVAGMNNTMPVIGGEIVELDFMADDDVAGGYLSLYILAEREGGTFKSSDQPRFLQNQTVFKGYGRYDGKPAISEGFVLLNINNVNPTTTVTFAGDQANVDLVSLKSLLIGTTASPIALFPPFSPDVLNYQATVATASNKITVETLKGDAVAVIKNGDTTVNSGSNATFASGSNDLKITVNNGTATERVYSVTVTL